MLHFQKERVRPGGVKQFVGPDQGHEIFGGGEIDDVVGIARQGMYYLYVFTTDLEFHYWEWIAVRIKPFLSFLDKAVAGNHNEKLPFGVVPVLTFRDSWLGNIHTELTTFCCS